MELKEIEELRKAMGKKTFVGGLSWNTDEEGLRQAFVGFDVEEVKIITDRDTGRSRGFGFVTFSDSESVSRSVQEMTAKDLDGRTIKVSEVEDKLRGGGGGGGYRGGGNRW